MQEGPSGRGGKVATVVAALFGLATVAVLLAANAMLLINYRDLENTGGAVNIIDANEGYIYFGIVGSGLSGLVYFALLFMSKQKCGNTMMMFLETVMGLQLALGTMEAVQLTNNSDFNSIIRETIDLQYFWDYTAQYLVIVNLTIAASVLAYVTGFLLSFIALIINIREGNTYADMEESHSPAIEMRRSEMN